MTFSNLQIISIEGNIGSGKSTLLEQLRNHFVNNESIIFLQEPVDEWAKIQDENGVTMLEKFYQNQKKYSFAFQMMAYISRLAALKKAVDSVSKQENHKTVIITERSLFTDKMVFAQMLYDSGDIEHIEHQIYLQWFDTFATEYPITKIVYVKTAPEICHFRILKRSRTGENCIPLEYLDKCHLYHEKMMSDDNVTKTQLILNGNTDKHENKKEWEDWIQEIEQFIV
jgi:deoxyadenosine/deoxycytidine kinase